MQQALVHPKCVQSEEYELGLIDGRAEGVARCERLCTELMNARREIARLELKKAMPPWLVALNTLAVLIFLLWWVA